MSNRKYYKSTQKIPLNVESRLSALSHKIELNVKTLQKFMPSPPTTPEKHCICLASASRRQDKNETVADKVLTSYRNVLKYWDT